MGGVMRFGLNGLEAHLLGLLQIFTVLTYVVGIVVEASVVVTFPFQTIVVSLVGLLFLAFAEKDVAHNGIEVGY